MEKTVIKEITSTVRGILNEWDPIGVASSELQDEYDCCLGGVIHGVMEGASTWKFYRHLMKRQMEHMGLRGNRLNTWRIARRLSKLAGDREV